MHLQSLVLASSLLLAPLLGVVSAYPRPNPLNTGIISSGQRQGTGRGGQGGRRKPKDGPDVPETAHDFTGSEGPSSDIPETHIFHGPDGSDGNSACLNPLPEVLLFSVEKGHDCIRMANIYNDQNTSARFNCKTPAHQKEALCGEAPNFGTLAANCYDFLTQNHPMKADAIKDYVGLCRQ